MPSGTPTAARSASVIATTPTAASAHATPRSHGRAFAFGPNVSRPVTAAPNRTTSPTYSIHRPATAPAVGVGVPDPVCSDGVTSPGETPTPNVNAPDVTWPSVADTVRHVTA